MGAADVVPGVSGGTVALVVGIYEPLVRSVRNGAAALGHLLRLDVRKALTALGRIDWWFIGPLALGLVAAVLTLARLIEFVLEDYPVGTSAFFFGLVVGSIPIAWAFIHRPAPVHLAIAMTSAVATWFVLGLRGDALTDPSLAVVFGSGAIAICAMILPGISGSLILLMLGMYDRVIEALNDRDLGVIATFAAGAVIGLALFSTLLEFLLRRYHDPVMAALVGLLLGSLRVLWPWPDGADSAAVGAPSGAWLAPVVLAFIGAGIVLTAGRLAGSGLSSDS
jgi:putative membrane protein